MYMYQTVLIKLITVSASKTDDLSGKTSEIWCVRIGLIPGGNSKIHHSSSTNFFSHSTGENKQFLKMRNTCVVPECQNCSLATTEQCRNSFWFTKLSNARLKPGPRSQKWYRNLEIWMISSFHHKVGFLVLRLHLICPRTGSLSPSIRSSIVNSEVQGRSKPELENLELRTQDLSRFWNCVLIQAEPRKIMWQCDEIVTFVPSSRKIVTFLEVLKKLFRNLVASHWTWNVTKCDEMWRKCEVTSFCHHPSLKPRSRFLENSGLERLSFYWMVHI